MFFGQISHILTFSLDTFQSIYRFCCKILLGISPCMSNSNRQSPCSWWKGSNIPSILYIKNSEKERLNPCLLCLLRLVLILTWGAYGPTAVGPYSGVWAGSNGKTIHLLGNFCPTPPASGQRPICITGCFNPSHQLSSNQPLNLSPPVGWARESEG